MAYVGPRSFYKDDMKVDRFKVYMRKTSKQKDLIITQEHLQLSKAYEDFIEKHPQFKETDKA